MKKLLMIAALAVSFGTVANAQSAANTNKGAKVKKGNATPEQLAERQANRAQKELGLSDEQKAKYQEFSLARIQAIRPLRDQLHTTKDKAERKKIHTDIKAQRQTFDTNVKGILTAEQLPKWEEAKKKAKEKAKAAHAKKKAGVEEAVEDETIPFED